MEFFRGDTIRVQFGSLATSQWIALAYHVFFIQYLLITFPSSSM
ncbi:hypothetical protein [Paenibacillus sp. JZ16]|nr:hypothetical protein [Paenibacillus sp. JZ16]